MKRKLSCLLLFGIILLAALLLAPWKTVVAPAARVRVFDESGNPARGVVVKQEWQYIAVGADHEYKEYSRTDADGYVAVPARTLRIAMLQRVLGAFRMIVTPHGVGAHARLWAHGADRHVWTFAQCSVNDPAPQELRLQRWDVEIYP
jgi:hypothetical protein